MHDWETYRQQWQAQATEAEAEQHLNREKMITDLRKHMNEFAQQYDAPGSLLTAGIVLGSMGLLALLAAVWGAVDGKEATFLLPMGILMTLVGGHYALQYRRRKQEPPAADLDTRAFVAQSLRRLKRHHQSRYGYLLLAVLILGISGPQWLGRSWEMDPLAWVGMGGFLLVSLFIFGALAWWNRHHNPAHPAKLRSELEALQASWDEGDG